MNRVEAIEFAKEQQEIFGGRMGEFLNFVEDELSQLPSAQQWIPVTERLPKNDDWVVVTVMDESGDTPYRYTHFGWYLKAADCWIVDSEQRNDVIAWMPLPEPYKE